MFNIQSTLLKPHWLIYFQTFQGKRNKLSGGVEQISKSVFLSLAKYFIDFVESTGSKSFDLTYLCCSSPVQKSTIKSHFILLVPVTALPALVSEVPSPAH